MPKLTDSEIMTADAEWWMDVTMYPNEPAIPRVTFLERDYGIFANADGYQVECGWIHMRPNQMRCFFALLIAEAVR